MRGAHSVYQMKSNNPRLIRHPQCVGGRNNCLFATSWLDLGASVVIGNPVGTEGTSVAARDVTSTTKRWPFILRRPFASICFRIEFEIRHCTSCVPNGFRFPIVENIHCVLMTLVRPLTLAVVRHGNASNTSPIFDFCSLAARTQTADFL